MVGVGIVWPTLHEASYLSWRTVAVGLVRLLVLGLPTNFDSHLFDVMTPALATGRFANLINLSTILLGGWQLALLGAVLCSWRPPVCGDSVVAACRAGPCPHTWPSLRLPAGTHACLLLFLALLIPLRLRPHMRVQTASVAMLLAFGVHTHCRSHVSAALAGGAGQLGRSVRHSQATCGAGNLKLPPCRGPPASQPPSLKPTHPLPPLAPRSCSTLPSLAGWWQWCMT